MEASRRASISLSGFLLLLSAHAQISFEYEDLAVPGDVVERYVDTLPAYGPGGSGVAQVWDFSAAIPHETVITTVSLPSATPYASSFTGSNVAMTNDGVNFLYFNSSPAGLLAKGAAGDFLNDGQQLVVPFSPDLTSHVFPRNYGDRFSDTYRFEVIASGTAFGVHSVRLRHRGDVRDTTDAYGQITTPIGTYEALRVKTIDYTVDSVWIRLFAFAPWTFAQASRDTTSGYTWLAKGTKLAVAEMTFDSLGAPARFTYSSLPPALTTGIPGATAGGLFLYPVPASDGLTLCLDHPGRSRTVEVLSPDGRVMMELTIGQRDRVDLDTRGWASGIYMVRVWPEDGGRPEVLRAVLH